VFLRSKAHLGSDDAHAFVHVFQLTSFQLHIFEVTSISSMPPKSKKRASKADDYGSDGGFVEDAPQSKRAKTAISKDKQEDEDGNPYWEASLPMPFGCFTY
jgi:hypothetical protein